MPVEMLEAGAEMVKECKKAKMDPVRTALQIYIAMEAVRELLERQDEGSVH